MVTTTTTKIAYALLYLTHYGTTGNHTCVNFNNKTPDTKQRRDSAILLSPKALQHTTVLQKGTKRAVGVILTWYGSGG